MLKALYLGLSVLGLVVPWYYNVLFMQEAGGFELMAFIKACFTTHPASSITVDLLIGASAFSLWMIVESFRIKMRHVWVYFVLSTCVAFAFAAPLFLFMRERHLEQRLGTEGPLADTGDLK